jgi:hypothetical protein
MTDRHKTMASIFVDYFGLPMDLNGYSVLDIGSFIGGSRYVFNLYLLI